VQCRKLVRRSDQNSDLRPLTSDLSPHKLLVAGCARATRPASSFELYDPPLNKCNSQVSNPTRACDSCGTVIARTGNCYLCHNGRSSTACFPTC
jgi:hypothetical protein